MSNYDEEQSEDGELAQSPAPRDEMDFSSLSSEGEADGADSLDIKPPQPRALAHSANKDRHHRQHRRRREHKKHPHRDRDQIDVRSKREIEMSKHSDREIFHAKEYYREREYNREKDSYREKESIRSRDHFREKDHKEIYRDRDVYTEKEIYRDKDAYRIKEPYREKDMYKDKDHHKDKDGFRDKELYREKDPYREREAIREKERISKHIDGDRSKSHRHGDTDRKGISREEARTRHGEEISRMKEMVRYSEKENRDKHSGDKELEDLRTRLLSKRQTKEQEVSRKRDDRMDSPEREPPKSSRLPELDRSQLERREKLLKTDSMDIFLNPRTEREMSHRRKASRAALEARREKLKEDGVKRSCTSPTTMHRKRRRHSRPASPSPPSPPTPSDEVVMVSDASDTEMKSDATPISNNSEEGTASSSESSSESSGEETESEEEEEDEEEDDKVENENHKHKKKSKKDVKEKEDEGRITEPPSPHEIELSPDSTLSVTPKLIDRETFCRSRSHSFSPPPIEENGVQTDPTPEVPVQQSPPPPPSPVDDLPPYYPALQGCRSVEEFQCLNRIEEGTYGVVYRARDKTTDEIVALKRLKMEKEKEGFPITSLREINTLLKGQHPNIVTVREIVVGSNMDKIFIVMDYVEHDLKGLMETMRSRKQVFLPGEVKCLMQQLLRAVDHLHDNWILHRDLKTSNLLLSHKGILKVGDFGLAREYGSPLKQYTPIVVTLWYRAPELLLGARQYSTPIDVWSVGCIFAEFITMNALFPGKSEVDQLNKIFKELGTPNETVWNGWSQLSGSRATWADQPGGGLRTRVGTNLSEAGLQLLQGLLTYDPVKRFTASQALSHPYFKEVPTAIDPAMFPTWPAKSEGGRRHQHSPKPPSGGDQYKLLRDEDQAAIGFHMGVPAPAPAPYLPPASSGFSLKF